ncbi:uncharacterized protein LOC116012947 [Ipomoea triloba]|uniref:uncharacterized protein LOC116012947 n=1 Tax=Ipomoea triloba TaxID=35885 RepID=UPI00125D24A8|nr:uncharacterized protein LOC116012947 [Ipomoea triloba]
MAAPAAIKISPRSIFPVIQPASNQSNQSLFFPKKTLSCRVSPSLMISSPPPPPVAAAAVERRESDGGSGGAFTEERLEEWMKGSVFEIVKKIKKAPLLVHVYGGGGGDGEEITAEHAVEDEWEGIKMEWEKGVRRLPDGVIFVEELCGPDGEVEDDDEGETKIWGIVVQGRGAGAGGDGSGGPICYLLKTTVVSGGAGLGLYCSYFTLIRVTSFRESALSQFNNHWLLR